MRKISHRQNPFYKVLIVYFVLQTSTMFLFFVNDSLNGQLLRDQIVFDNVIFFRVLIISILIITNVFILYILKKLYTYISTAEKAKIESAKYRYLERELKVYRKHRHDMKNHLMIIYEMSKSSKYDELENYISKYYKGLTSTKLSVETGVDELDMLLANKFVHLQEHDIPFTFNANVKMRIGDACVIDFVSLFSNIIDNAYEACSKIADKSDRLISINISDDKLDYIIVVTNTTLPITNINRFRKEGASTKSKKGQHGFGLSIIENLVHKHEGMVNFEVLNERFFQVKVEVPKHVLHCD